MNSSDYAYDTIALANLSTDVADLINGDKWGSALPNGVELRCNVDVLTVAKMLVDNWAALNYQVIYP